MPNPAPSLKGLMTISETAKACGVSEYHVKSWVESGRLAAYTPYESRMFVLHPEDVLKFYMKHMIELKDDELNVKP